MLLSHASVLSHLEHRSVAFHITKSSVTTLHFYKQHLWVSTLAISVYLPRTRMTPDSWGQFDHVDPLLLLWQSPESCRRRPQVTGKHLYSRRQGPPGYSVPPLPVTVKVMRFSVVTQVLRNQYHHVAREHLIWSSLPPYLVYAFYCIILFRNLRHLWFVQGENYTLQSILVTGLFHSTTQSFINTHFL